LARPRTGGRRASVDGTKELVGRRSGISAPYTLRGKMRSCPPGRRVDSPAGTVRTFAHLRGHHPQRCPMAEFAVTSIPAPGGMNVDFEERVDVGRLRSYRLRRAREALEHSELGAVLCFDMNNIRYLTSTNIGEWARAKLMRFAVLTRTGEPVVRAFGSA